MAHAKKKATTKERRPEVLRLVFDTDAHREMDEHCSVAPRNEVCGVLVGFTGEDAAGRWTRVVGVIKGLHAREDQMSVTFTHETWDAVHSALAKRADKARVIGWYHSHPDFGIFYSSPDLFVHRNFFGLEGQVGVVVDPVRGERGVFANTSRGLRTLERYEVARQNKGGHLLPCKYVEEPLRDATPEARAAGEPDSGAGGFVQSNLDSIELALARVERQLTVVTRIICIGVPVLLLLAVLAGMYIGRRTFVLEVPQGAIEPSRPQVVVPNPLPPHQPAAAPTVMTGPGAPQEQAEGGKK